MNFLFLGESPKSDKMTFFPGLDAAAFSDRLFKGEIFTGGKCIATVGHHDKDLIKERVLFARGVADCQMAYSGRPGSFPRDKTIFEGFTNFVGDDLVNINFRCRVVGTHNSDIYRLVTLFVCDTKIRKSFELAIQKSNFFTLFLHFFRSPVKEQMNRFP